MNPNKKISFCIPTFNRLKFLRHTLESIIKSTPAIYYDQVEICISDNASEDETEIYIKDLCLTCPITIVYHRNEKNYGADINYMKCIEISNSDYCWFLGSDDAIVDGAVQSLLSFISSYNADIYLCNRIECDFHLNPLRERSWLNKDIKDKLFIFESEKCINDYFNSCQSLGGVFSYLSSIIFKKSKWDKYTSSIKYFNGTAYSHVAILIQILINNGILFYTTKCFVLCRGENDSFAQDGLVKRIMLDFNGYKLIADKYLTKKESKRIFLNILLKERKVIRTLIQLRIRQNDSEWNKTTKELKQFGYSPTIINIVFYFKKMFIFYLFLRRFFTGKKHQLIKF